MMHCIRAVASSCWQTIGTGSFGLDTGTSPTFSTGVAMAANCHLVPSYPSIKVLCHKLCRDANEKARPVAFIYHARALSMERR